MSDPVKIVKKEIHVSPVNPVVSAKTDVKIAAVNVAASVSAATPDKSAVTINDALSHVEKVIEHALTFGGKDKHNPYLYLEQHKVYAIKDALLKGDGTAISAAMKLKIEDPSIDKLKFD